MDETPRDEPLDLLLPELYDQLRAMAASLAQHERRGHTLQATALVHEAYVRLRSNEQIKDDIHQARLKAFFGKEMKRILVDYARARASQKRPTGTTPATGQRRVRVDLTRDPSAPGRDIMDMLELEEALGYLDGETREMVEERGLGGMTYAEIALVHGCSEAKARTTVKAAREQMRPFLTSVPVFLEDGQL